MMSSNTVNKSLFEFFDNLGVKSQAKRSESCIALVQHLATQDAPKDFMYSLKRLIKGLGATREPLAKGSFTALVSLLDTFSTTVTSDTFLKLVNQEYGEVLSKKEEGEVHVGKALAYGAAIRGGLFSRSSNEHQKMMIKDLIHSGEKRSYLPSVVSSFLYDLIFTCDKSVLADIIWPVLEEEILNSKRFSCETLMLILSVYNRAPNVVKSKPIKVWLGFSLFSSESMELFAQKLIGECTPSTINHPIYDQLGQALCKGAKEPLLETFWTVSVNSVLTENKNKIVTHATIRMFTAIISQLTNKQQIGMLLMPSFISVLGRILSMPLSDRKSSEVYQMAQEALNLTKSALASEDVPEKVRLNVLCKIFFDTPELQSETLSGFASATFSDLLDNLGSKSVHELAKRFRSVIDGVSNVDGQALTNVYRRIAVQQFARLMSHSACNDDWDWKTKQVVFLLDRAIFIQETPSTINSGLAHTLKECFFSALDQKFPNLETFLGVLSQAVTHVNGKLSPKSMRTPLSSEALDSWHKMYGQVTRIEEKGTNKKSAIQIFHLLFLSMGLQLLSDPKLATSALDELHSCYQRMKSSKKRSSKIQDEPEWVEVTIDLFLSLLSHDSHLLRTIVGKAFPYLGQYLTVSAFCQILEVIDPKQNENPLTAVKDGDDASESESDSDSEEDDNISDAKQLNGKHKTKPENGSEGEDNDGEDEDEDDEDFDDIDEEEEETVNDKLRQEIRLALGNAASLTDTESVDLDDIDEEEGQRVDAALAAAFKTMKMSKGKSDKKEKKEEPVSHFRSRVLDLIEIYITKDPSMDICQECITPLLSLLDFCMKDARLKTVENKAKSILHKLTNVKKFSSMNGVNEEAIANQIELLAVKGFGNASTFLRLSNLIYECCAFLVRCSELVRSQSSKPDATLKDSPVVRIYKTLLLDFFTKRKSLLSIEMFKSVLNLRWNGWWYIAPSIIQYAFDSKVLLFRRGQALDLLIHFFRNSPMLSTANKLDALKKMVASIMDHTVQFLNTTEKDYRLNQHVPSVLRLVHRILNNPTIKPADTSTLSTALTSFCQRGAGIKKDTKRILRSLAQELGLDVKNLKEIKNFKNKSLSSRNNEEEHEVSGESDDADEVNGSAGVSRQKAKHSAPKGKGKKQKKLQRLAAMGQGLDSITFCDINSDVINGLEPEDDDDNVSESNHETSNNLKPNSRSHSKRKPKPAGVDDSQISKKKKKRN
ncbi:hypothetical protein ONE63_004165 [Megalurothrips usitatus]|uniref:Myb-binding protein 1A n=1 Tax=Megalurothrips usitatus TaxID=439358 RepID=A0AAV7X8U9_9NEOP|nr:hypothetical protein ONE63_004165 [Megalurothrips usitatus]